MDIDRLHKCLDGYNPRRYGRTYTTLVLALHEADFSNDRVVITAHSKQWALELAKMTYRIAQEMGFEQISFVKPDTLFVNNTEYTFVTRQLDKEWRGIDAPLFHDRFN